MAYLKRGRGTGRGGNVGEAVDTGVSHIIPGVLYPAVAHLKLDGTVTTSTTDGPNGTTLGTATRYGSVQTDGRMYYYTDIKGSKPIKDPRVGAHFGSHRHDFRSLQLLEQETSFNIQNVYSIDGREWARAHGNRWELQNDQTGCKLYAKSPPTVNDWIEITGYFNLANHLATIYSNTATNVNVLVDGSTTSTAFAPDAVMNTPQLDRFISAASLQSLPIGDPPLGIHTLKIGLTTTYWYSAGIELIAQDRGSNTGSDLAFNNSATSMGSLTEANATAGWSNTNLGTFESAAVSAAGGTPPAGVGTYALHLVATGSGQYSTSSAITVVVGTRYKVVYHYKATNGDANTLISLYGGTAAGNGNTYCLSTFPDSDWHSHEVIFTATTTSFYFTFQETGAGNDINIYFAGITLFALSNDELSQVQIPSQNVISFGKKRTIASTPRFNPFDQAEDGTAVTINSSTTNTAKLAGGWSGTGSTYYSSELDESTSLGLGAWEHSTAFADSGDSTHNLTVNGNAHKTGIRSQIGTMSMYFDGSGDNVYTGQSTDFQFGTGAFTIEWWSNWDKVIPSGSQSTVCYGSGNGVEGWKILFNSATTTWYGGSTAGSLDRAHLMTANRWYHWAIVRQSGGRIDMYKDGVSLGNYTNAGSMGATSSYGIWVATTGGGTSGTQQYKGYLDEVRISKGVARYTGNFTPSTTAFTSDSNTSLLLHSTNGDHYRPVNGGRVVWWVDSSGTLKSSVNVMPPAATVHENGEATEESQLPTGAHNWATKYQPAVHRGNTGSGNGPHGHDHSQSELARTYYLGEYGNGAGNGNDAAYKDMSRLFSDDSCAFVMSDGLTSAMSINHRFSSMGESLHRNSSAGKFYTNFIGTGIGRTASFSGGIIETFAQNLPYGTHTFSHIMTSSDESNFYVDGVMVYNNNDSPYYYYHNVGSQLHIHQPKMPPIPEDACVVGDYMLMADFVGQTNHLPGHQSKGTRKIHTPFDFYYNASGSITAAINTKSVLSYTTVGPYVYIGNAAHTVTQELPYFGTSFTGQAFTLSPYVITTGSTYTINNSSDNQGRHDLSSYSLYGGGGGYDSTTSAGVVTRANSTDTENFFTATGGVLGVAKFKLSELAASSKYQYANALYVACPTHTSSHYQSFETPFLHELVGGDRNMEQTNLVVTPNGETWDEVTRDTSYQSNIVLAGMGMTNTSDSKTISEMGDVRGSLAINTKFNGIQKDCIALRYDKFIILKDGLYKIEIFMRSGTTDTNGKVVINSEAGSPAATEMFLWKIAPTGKNVTFDFPPIQLCPGNYICFTRTTGTITGQYVEDGPFFQITKLA